MPTLAHTGATGRAPARSVVPAVVAEYPLSPFESLIATLSERRDGRRVAAITRIKRTGDGSLRRMTVFEFGDRARNQQHRCSCGALIV